MAVAAPVLEKVALSQMEIVTKASENSLVAGLSGGKNVTFTAGGIADLVTKERLNLDKVQNLSPNELPVSDATARELSKKMDKTGTISIGQVDGLATALDNKLDKDGQIEMSQVNGLPEKITELETGPIEASRVTGLSDAVTVVIDNRTDLINQVIKGPMGW